MPPARACALSNRGRLGHTMHYEARKKKPRQTQKRNPMEQLDISPTDKIAVIAPHPDDECLGASAALIRHASQTDIYVLTDGCYGSKTTPPDEEAVIRKQQFEAEMQLVKPNAWHWLGMPDKGLSDRHGYFEPFDFAGYDLIFIPWQESLHPDHRAAANEFVQFAAAKKLKAKLFSYEINAPFSRPTHYCDITDIYPQKAELVRCHKDQLTSYRQDILCESLNRFRASQRNLQDAYCECYLFVDHNQAAQEYVPCDHLAKLYTLQSDLPESIIADLASQGITFKQVMSLDIQKVHDFISDEFAPIWASEALPALINGDCTVAVCDRSVVGFVCVNATAKGFVGPVGVAKDFRRRGIATALAYHAAKRLYSQGYKYAIFGMAAQASIPTIERIMDSTPIPNSAGSYKDRI